MKEELRKTLLEKRKGLDPLAVKELSERILQQLSVFDPFVKAKVVMFYASLNNEVDTLGFLESCFLSKQVVLPKVQGEEIIPSMVSSFSHLDKGYLGILEPREIIPIKEKTIDLVLVPAVAYDKKGNRIGYGAGYYDKFLKTVPQAIKVGLAYDFQVVEQIEAEDHDVPMDWIITLQGVISCKQ